AKLEKVNHETVPNYEKPDAHIQSPNNEKWFVPEKYANVWSETVNMVAINQREVMVNVEDMTEQSTSSNGSNLPNIKQDLHDELTMDNPFL
ncbi:17825_t:CDS:2, partial [Gigaspora rosea]